MIRKIGLLAVSGAVNMACLSAAHAVNYFNIGDARAVLDTTVTYGIQARTSSADSENLDSSYGNRLFNDSGDIVSNRIRASHTLQIDRGRFGALVRGNYSYDRAFDTKDLPSEAEDRLVFDALLTDAFIHGTFGPWNNVNIRLGKQVISWGENTFIQGSLNDINTVDVTKLRQPGS
ncbi:MAG: DUF1302 family protein, partial [Pseudomonadota bacterium]|nr:DUF1302 family protein [Pseudomonadota bacterium]